MNNRKTKYWICPILGIIATVILSLAVARLAQAPLPLPHINALVNERGWMAYLVMSFGFSVIFFATRAILVGDFRPRLSALMMILSTTPLIWGLLGTLMGLAIARSWVLIVSYTQLTEPELADVISKSVDAYVVAFDTMLLAIIFTTISFSIAFMHWTLAGGAKYSLTAYDPHKRIPLFRPWLAYHVTASILTLLAGISVGSLAIVVLATMGVTSNPWYVMLWYIIGFGISIAVSYPVFKWIFYKMIYVKIAHNTDIA